ncbi:2-keto-4-pentenoate hydratase [Amycolatopsis sp. cg5]|uniref:2-keto-4-pentenoate hydratase n=1 Tax=Amycolatopsis sp. cg5 TaxID=3238802 RepID=UPI0035234620
MNSEDRAAALLWEAWQAGNRLEALPEDVRPADAAQAMAVQDKLAELVGPHYGWKIAATTPLGQAHIGVDGPFPGRLFTRFRHDEGEPVPADSLTMAVAEAEFAFRMREDLVPGKEYGLDEVLDAVDSMFLALEMPDSRYFEYAKVGLVHLLADAACSSRFVVGRDVPGWRDVDLPSQEVVLRLDGAEFARGTGAQVLGDPRVALHWLVGDLHRYGHPLRAGDVVTTGTATKPCPTAPGAHVVADFGDLGKVEASFV